VVSALLRTEGSQRAAAHGKGRRVERKRKPKAGAALMSAEWFLSVGLQGSSTPAQSELSSLVERDIRRVLAALEPHFDLVYPGPVCTAEAASAAVRRFRAEGAELLILVHLMWSEDGPLVRLLREASGLPLLLWCYNPYERLPQRMSTNEMFRASGPVGFLQGSAPLARMGVRFTSVFGYPEDRSLAGQLAECASAFAARAGLSRLRVGTIGPRCESMAGGWVDEFALLARLGVSLVPVSVNRLAEEARAVPVRAVQAFLLDLASRCLVRGVSERSLELAARSSLAVAALVEKEALGAVAIEDLNPELHRMLGTRPCLWVPSLTELEVAVGMEGDVASTLGLWLARRLGGSEAMYTEIFTFDQADNCLLFGHAGMQDPALAGEGQVTVVADAEYAAADEVEGAWLSFTARPGPVTALSLFTGLKDYRLAWLRGEVLETREKLASFPHALVRIEPPLHEFYERAARAGMTQHFALSYDAVEGKLARLAEVLGLEVLKL
jgi:L-arabinose isomerase